MQRHVIMPGSAFFLPNEIYPITPPPPPPYSFMWCGSSSSYLLVLRKSQSGTEESTNQFSLTVIQKENVNRLSKGCSTSVQMPKRLDLASMERNDSSWSSFSRRLSPMGEELISDSHCKLVFIVLFGQQGMYICLWTSVLWSQVFSAYSTIKG